MGAIACFDPPLSHLSSGAGNGAAGVNGGVGGFAGGVS